MKMQRILCRRVLRDLRANLFRYLALFLLIVLGMYLVVAVVGAAETVMQCVAESYEKNRGEDGQFGTFVPLTEEEIGKITDKGVILEPEFYLDYKVQDATLRIMKDRQQIDLFVISEGRGLEAEGEILLEQHYAAAHTYTLGSRVQVGSSCFTVVGLGSTPDYDGMFEKLSDTSADSMQFGIGFVSASDYDNLREKAENFRTEEYVYAYCLNDSITDDELKELIQSFELDRNKVTDSYFLQMLDEAEKSKTDIQEGIDELLDGSRELADGLQEIADNNQELTDAADSLFDAMLEQANDGFRDNDIDVTLEASTFETQLDQMIASTGNYSEATKASLRDLKQSLQDLKDFREGVVKYTDGVEKAKDGTGTLWDGLGRLTDNNDVLKEGASTLFERMLMQANTELAENFGAMGVSLPVQLTEENFETVLDTMIQTYGGYSAQLAASLTALKEQLAALKTFKDGIGAYTGGVSAAKEGSYALYEGMIELADNSPELKDAANAVFDGMLETVREQLSESGIEVNLTAENFAAELDRLTARESRIDAELRDTLRDTKETLLDLREFCDGITEYTDAVQEAADGSRELADGVEELKDAADDMLEEYFTFDLDNLTSFMKKQDNPRIYASYNDLIINRYAGMAAGIIVMILFTYVISVFVIHNIEQESSMIGALYALGIKRNQLVVHYLLLPVTITLLGGLAGSVLGFSPVGVGWQMGDTLNYFSVPPIHTVFPLYLIVYSVVMPPVIAVVVNFVFINKKLKCTALSLIRGEQKTSRTRDVNLGRRMGFIRRFQLRQMLRELRSAMAVIIGMYVCLIIAMLCLDCYVLCENYKVSAVDETKYEYMYTYKYPTEEVPEGGIPAYMEGLSREAYGYRLEVTVLGITRDNPYFDVEVSDRKNEIVISSAVSEKFNLKTGDKLILSDDVNNQDYAFTVKDIVYMESAFYTFMDIDAMRELFGQEDDYYNVVFSDRALNIDSGRLYSTTTRENILVACGVFADMMGPMITVLSVAAAIIFIVVMYLMVKVMIDRSAFSIALVKIFGFRKREIRKLYLNGNFLLVALGALVCVPLAKWTMDAVFPYCIANVAIGMDLVFSWRIYLGTYFAVILCYLAITPLLTRRIQKMVPAEVLKNRE